MAKLSGQVYLGSDYVNGRGEQLRVLMGARNLPEAIRQVIDQVMDDAAKKRMKKGPLVVGVKTRRRGKRKIRPVAAIAVPEQGTDVGTDNEVLS